MENVEKEKKVSCIVLSYNSGEKLYRAIDSIIMQDYPNIELLIFDDCSNEFDAEKVKNYIGKRFASCIVRKQPGNIGTVKNYNAAIEKSTGEYIINLAADDYFIDNRVVSKIVNKFETTGADIVVADAMDVKSGRKNNILQKKRFFRWLKKNRKRAFNYLAKENFISGATTYYSKKYFEHYGLFDEVIRIIEDWPNMLKAVEKGASIAYMQDVTIMYSDGGVSTATDKNSTYLTDYVAIIEKQIFSSDTVSFFTRRYLLYMLERIKYKKKVPLGLSLKYVDVIVYKMIKKITSNAI